jgi:hypothetical protein
MGRQYPGDATLARIQSELPEVRLPNAMHMEYVGPQAVEDRVSVDNPRLSGLLEVNPIGERMCGGAQLGRSNPRSADDGHLIPGSSLGAPEPGNDCDRTPTVKIHVVDDMQDAHYTHDTRWAFKTGFVAPRKPEPG